MGKKGSWFSAIKRVFTHYSKGKDSDNKNTKEKKKGLGKLKHGETNSFIPLFREPSSIEKIFGDFEREQQQQQQLVVRPPTPPELPKTPPVVPPRVASPRPPSPRASSPRAPSPRAASPRVTSPKAASSRNVHHHKEVGHRPEPTLRNQHASATKIQAAYRGYMARRSFRALKGLVRLQGVVRGQNVKRQTVNAMKHMQLLVRVQSQIQSRRIQMLENQARYQAEFKNAASALGKTSEAGNNEDWDDSLLTKEEIEARLQRKVEAIIKRERAMAFAYSHQLWKATPKSTQTPVTDIRSGGFPWWWNWLERQLPAANPQEGQVPKSFHLTPPRPYSEQKTSPRPASSSTQRQQHHFAFDNMDTPTPKSTKSTIFPSSRPPRTPPFRTPQANSSSTSSKHPRPTRGAAVGANSPFDVPLKDDESLTSCPPFSVPNYMAPTVSAKAKVRASSNPRERSFGSAGSVGGGTPNSDSRRRLSFPLPQGIGSFKWAKGSLFSSNKDPVPSSHNRTPDNYQSLESLGNVSVDSTVSLPARVGRKPFTRFV